MKIEALNQHDSNKAEARVTVGCGLDGDEGNEPSFHYHINPDGLKIWRDTEDGNPWGYVELNNADLGCLCGSPQHDDPSPAFQARAVQIVEQHLGYRTGIYSGDEAKEQLRECLGRVWTPGAVGKAWVLSSHRPGWSELGYRDFAGAESAEAVMVDCLDDIDKDLTWKYTYYPQNGVGLYLVHG